MWKSHLPLVESSANGSVPSSSSFKKLKSTLDKPPTEALSSSLSAWSGSRSIGSFG